LVHLIVYVFETVCDLKALPLVLQRGQLLKRTKQVRPNFVGYRRISVDGVQLVAELFGANKKTGNLVVQFQHDIHLAVLDRRRSFIAL
jgi:hypothetical protein